jgi:hypothetical protein
MLDLEKSIQQVKTAQALSLNNLIRVELSKQFSQNTSQKEKNTTTIAADIKP